MYQLFTADPFFWGIYNLCRHCNQHLRAVAGPKSAGARMRSCTTAPMSNMRSTGCEPKSALVDPGLGRFPKGNEDCPQTWLSPSTKCFFFRQAMFDPRRVRCDVGGGHDDVWWSFSLAGLEVRRTLYQDVHHVWLWIIILSYYIILYHVMSCHLVVYCWLVQALFLHFIVVVG